MRLKNVERALLAIFAQRLREGEVVDSFSRLISTANKPRLCSVCVISTVNSADVEITGRDKRRVKNYGNTRYPEDSGVSLAAVANEISRPK